MGFVTVKQRKTSGRFDVSEYWLNDEVEISDTEAMSENLQCGGKQEPKQAMSENLQSGKLTSGFLPSEELMSEELGHENFGHANINNTTTSNIHANIKHSKEQFYDHQPQASDDESPTPAFSLEQTKEIIRFEFWLREAEAWGKLKELLGHFTATGYKARYERRTNEVLDEIARQVRELLNSTQKPERVAAMLDSEAFAEFFDRVLTHWDEIRSTQGYVNASLENMRKSCKV